MTIINIYAPKEEADEEIKEVFYKEIQLVINRIPNNDLILIVGDYIAKIGKEVTYQNISGKYSLHNITSNNGEKVCSLAEVNQLMIMSTCFELKRIQKAKWISPDNKTMNETDHILVNKR
jgi:hypothetical protein